MWMNVNLAKCYFNLPFYKQCNNSKKTFFNNNLIKSSNVFYVKSMTQKYLQNTQLFASNHIFPTTGPLNPHTKVNKLCVRYISLYTQKYLRMNLISRNIFWKFTNDYYALTEMSLRNLLWGSLFFGKKQVPLQHHEINSKTQNWESAIMAGSGRNFTSAAAYKSRRTRRQLVWQHRDSIHCKHGNPSEHQLFRRSCISEIMTRTSHDVRLLILGFCFWIKVRILF